MKLLHTSDWHLGITLNECSRTDEMLAFFDFLRSVIDENDVDTLIISGDIYDSVAPSNEAEQMYYNFLSSLIGSKCNDVIIIAGNHDSPSKLNTTKDFLENHNIHIYTSALGLEPLVLSGKAVILPVPFPRDQELRRCALNDSIEDSDDKFRDAIKRTYDTLLEKARVYDLPIIATGHLAVKNAKGGENKSDLYVGGLGVVDASIFSDEIKYTALGHIHKPQALNAAGTIRYSGSPIAMSFDESKYNKSVVIADVTKDRDTEIKVVDIPVYRKLFQIKGSHEELIAGLKTLIDSKESGWVSLLLDHFLHADSLKEEAELLTKGSGIKVISIKDLSYRSELERNEENIRPLSVMSEDDVFMELIDSNSISEEKAAELLDLFHIAIKALKESDSENPVC